MANASKECQETYETNLSKIKDSASFFTVPIYELILCESTTEAKVDSKLSSKCFVYTINITIGVMFVILFMMLMAVHIVWVMCKAKQICNQLIRSECIFLSLSIIVVIVMTIYIVICLICYCIKKRCMKSNEKKEFDVNEKTTNQESSEKKEVDENKKVTKQKLKR